MVCGEFFKWTLKYRQSYTNMRQQTNCFLVNHSCKSLFYFLTIIHNITCNFSLDKKGGLFCTKSGVTKIWEDGYCIVAVSHENLWIECTDEVSGFTETSNNLGNSTYPQIESEMGHHWSFYGSVCSCTTFSYLLLCHLLKWIILYSV